MNQQSLLDQVLEIADTASRKVMEIYQTDFQVQTKDDNSPITEADIASHHVIVDGLTALTPDIPILSEESANAPWEERKTWTRFWLVDPIDGTKDFTNRTGEFTVNIALIENGEPVMGVVTAPALGDAYWGIKGQGAWKREADGSTRRLAVENPPQAIRAVASKNHMNEDTRHFTSSWASTNWSRPAAASSSAASPKARPISTRALGPPANGTPAPPTRYWSPPVARLPSLMAHRWRMARKRY